MCRHGIASIRPIATTASKPFARISGVAVVAFVCIRLHGSWSGTTFVAPYVGTYLGVLGYTWVCESSVLEYT